MDISHIIHGYITPLLHLHESLSIPLYMRVEVSPLHESESIPLYMRVEVSPLHESESIPST